jgi:hypothetical protein
MAEVASTAEVADIADRCPRLCIVTVAVISFRRTIWVSRREHLRQRINDERLDDRVVPARNPR